MYPGRSLWRTRPVVESTLKIDADQQQTEEVTQPKKFYVRVLLAEGKIQDRVSWCLQAPDGFMVQDFHKKERMNAQLPKICLSWDDVSFYINGKKVHGTTLIIHSKSKNCMFNASVYEGSFLFIRDNQKIYGQDGH
jgi:hypothetical protein